MNSPGRRLAWFSSFGGLASLAWLAAGCTERLPVRYELCDVKGNACTVRATFEDLTECERHKKFEEMLCDTSANPIVTVCHPPETPSTIASTRCAR